MSFALIAKSIIKNVTSGGGGKVIDAVTGLIDKSTFSKEEKEAKRLEFEQLYAQIEKEKEEQATKQLEAVLSDMQSARDREIQIATSDSAPLINKIVTPILGFSIILLTFILFYIVLFRTLGAEKDVVIYILGVLSAITTQIISYYFGSSSGSTKKDDTINKMQGLR
jgi:Fe2+ transport system protein B